MAITGSTSQLIVLPQAGIEPLGRDSGLRAGSAPVSSPEMGYEAWVMSGNMTGVAGGGNAVFTFNFPLSEVDQRYYCITALQVQRLDTGVDGLCRMIVTPAMWEIYAGQTLGSDFQRNFALLDDGVFTSVSPYERMVPIYLGRGIQTGGGPNPPSVRFAFATNTDTVVYQFRIAGVRSFRPGMPWYNVLQQAAAL